MTLSHRVLPSLAAVATVAALLTGCGGDDGGGDRPSADEISESIQSGELFGSDIDPAVADCVAEAFHDSDLSDDALQAIVDQDEDYDASDEDQEAIESIQSEEMADCVAEGMDLPDPEDPEAS